MLYKIKRTDEQSMSYFKTKKFDNKILFVLIKKFCLRVVTGDLVIFIKELEEHDEFYIYDEDKNYMLSYCFHIKTGKIICIKNRCLIKI